MPPKGDRPSAPSKDRDRQGPGNVGAGNAASGMGGAGGAASRGGASAPDKERDRGFFGGFSGLRDMFDGGGPGKSSPAAAGTAGMRAGPRARPDVVKTGTGKDAKFMDTRTGQSFAAPSYGAFSFQGLTSNDPANVARNRYGREGLEAMRAGRDDRGGDRGNQLEVPIIPPPVIPGPETVVPTPEEPPTPIVVDSPYTFQYDARHVLSPEGGYGSAFGPMNGYGMPFMDSLQPFPINFIDIFDTYPDFNRR